jgi:hypothetical protein
MSLATAFRRTIKKAVNTSRQNTSSKLSGGVRVDVFTCTKSSRAFSSQPTQAKSTISVGKQQEGFLTIDELKTKVHSGEVETVIMAFTDHVGRWMGKRYDADFFLEEGVNGSHACEYLFTTDPGMNIIRNFKFANWYVRLKDRAAFLISKPLTIAFCILGKPVMVIFTWHLTLPHSELPLGSPKLRSFYVM